MTDRALLDVMGCVARFAPRGLVAFVAAVGVCGLMLTTGCYTYQLKAPSDLLAGQNVEVQVNNVGRVALTNDLGDDVAKFNGKVVTVSDTTLGVSVTHIEYLNGSSTGFPGGTVIVSRNAITSVSTKAYSKSKTTVAAIGIIASIVALIAVLHATGFSDSGPGSKGTGENQPTQNQ
ncbi:MAG: hypothetical protein ABI311_00780 [Gemmatimonadaceae bacterium]